MAVTCQKCDVVWVKSGLKSHPDSTGRGDILFFRPQLARLKFFMPELT